MWHLNGLQADAEQARVSEEDIEEETAEGSSEDAEGEAASSEEPEATEELVAVEAQAPSQDGNTVTVPEVEGVSYSSGSGQVEVPEGGITIEASAQEGYELSGETSWSFEHQTPSRSPSPPRSRSRPLSPNRSLSRSR